MQPKYLVILTLPLKANEPKDHSLFAERRDGRVLIFFYYFYLFFTFYYYFCLFSLFIFVFTFIFICLANRQ